MFNRIKSLMVSTSPVALNADGASGGGDGGDPGAVAAAGDKPAAETVLFPKEGEKPADPSAGKKDGEGGGEGDWKEYVPDPSKSAGENARLKAEHDKTKPADKKDDAADKVPDDGKYALKMPDGVELDKEMADALGPEFKALNLTNAQAQKLVDKYIEIQQNRAAENAKDAASQWSAGAYNYFKTNGTPDQWPDKAKADKEMGGDKWDATVTSARRGISAFGTPALKEFLQASGAGNHPELIRAFAKAGELVKEDKPAGGGAEGAGKPADPAHVLFPNDAPKG